MWDGSFINFEPVKLIHNGLGDIRDLMSEGN